MNHSLASVEGSVPAPMRERFPSRLAEMFGGIFVEVTESVHKRI